MPTSRQTARDCLGETGNAPVSPGIAAVWRDLQDTQRVHTIGRPHMGVIGSTPALLAPGRAAVAAGCAALLAVAVYVNALQNPFVYDDFRLIVENPTILNPWDLESVIVRDITRP